MIIDHCGGGDDTSGKLFLSMVMIMIMNTMRMNTRMMLMTNTMRMNMRMMLKMNILNHLWWFVIGKLFHCSLKPRPTLSTSHA